MTFSTGDHKPSGPATRAPPAGAAAAGGARASRYGNRDSFVLRFAWRHVAARQCADIRIKCLGSAIRRRPTPNELFRVH
ncbi:hypothetical protein EVAR_88862_1 [Eumeta japonica]|uniref:Uncharacterized protein n=1 Tax=Eumeta variegata TaxID=151549 RepID=A0A4C1Y819_EUMVA|nr:hypothetical protein EVAR_88862_1 [Eumeta japonica]